MLTADLEVKHLQNCQTSEGILNYVDDPLTSIVSNFSIL